MRVRMYAAATIARAVAALLADRPGPRRRTSSGDRPHWCDPFPEDSAVALYASNTQGGGQSGPDHVLE